MNQKPVASIIIPSRGMEHSLRRLFEILALELAGQNVEVILVDDGSEKPLIFLADEFSGKLNLRVIRQKPKGPAVARNFGWKSAQSDLVIFLDSDVLPQPGWFSALINPLMQDPGLAGVEGKTISSNIEDLTPFSHFLYNLKGGVYLTCNIAYRKEWIERAGGFDERFIHPWREDSDLAFSILERGGKILFEPKAVVDHPVRKVDLWRLFWFYPIRRGYDWLIYRKHPQYWRQLEFGFPDKSELTFCLTFMIALGFFVLDLPVPGLITLLFHQAVYNHIFLRRLYFGKRTSYNFSVPWRIFIKAYPFFYPSVFLSMGSFIWGWVRFMGVKPAIESGKDEK